MIRNEQMKDLPDTCLEIENTLPLWVGGDLEPEALRAVEEHLVRCARCAESGAKARRARSALRQGLSLEVQRIGAGLDPWPRLRSSLRAEGLLPASTKSTAGLVGSRRGPIAVRWATAAALLFALAFAWTRLTENTTTDHNPRPIEVGSTAYSHDPSTGALVVMPAVNSTGLRHLSPNEQRLRDTAQIFGAPEDPAPGTLPDHPGSPAGLERPITVPPR
jgi:anti-sigma factor RsiW